MSWFPGAGLEWLVPNNQARLLNLGGGAAFARLLAGRVPRVIWARRKPVAAGALNVECVAATAQALPFDAATFDIVTAHQSLHEYNRSSLAEVARVLRPGGTFAVSYLVRDDSVPWVRRLIELVRHYDPQAMSGDYGADSAKALDASKYFPTVSERQFRVWRPISRPAMVDLVLSQPLARGLDDGQRARLTRGVLELYEDSAPRADDLMLPFRLNCWAGVVSHDELTTPVTRPDPGLRIHL